MVIDLIVAELGIKCIISYGKRRNKEILMG